MERFRCKTMVEKAWLATSLLALVLHRLLEFEPDVSGLWLVEWVMIALTFPFGPIAMLFIAIAVDGTSGYTEFGWMFDWSTMLLVGYLQWFFVLPELRHRSQLTTLNLAAPVEMAAPVEIISSIESRSPVEIGAPVATPDNALTLPAAAPVVFNASSYVPALAEFDEAGLTALGRVLQAHETSPPAR